MERLTNPIAENGLLHFPGNNIEEVDLKKIFGEKNVEHRKDSLKINACKITNREAILLGKDDIPENSVIRDGISLLPGYAIYLSGVGTINIIKKPG